MNYGKNGKMKYLEELNSGDCFSLNRQVFLLTSDFKKDGRRLCFSLSDGFPQWFSGGETIEINPVYSLDADNNIVPIKVTEKDNVVS